jgi:hypothetical protein
VFLSALISAILSSEIGGNFLMPARVTVVFIVKAFDHKLVGKYTDCFFKRKMMVFDITAVFLSDHSN